jgi:hypothetical protein
MKLPATILFRSGPATTALVLALGACSSGPDYPEYDLSGDIPRTYHAPYTSDSPVIDGKLDDLAWRRADWTANFGAVDGSSYSRPHLQSRAKMMWDEQYLYVGVWMVEPNLRSEPVSTLGFDGLRLFVAHTADQGSYQLLGIEPGGRVSNQVIVTRPVEGVRRNMVGLRHAVALSGTLNTEGDADFGWWVEFALPWDALTTPDMATVPRAGATWRLNLARRQQAWSPHFESDLHDAGMWGKVELTR